MTESSTVTKTEDKATEKGAEKKTVPVEAVGEARAQKRAAQERAETAETALAGQLHGDDLLAITDKLAAEARKAVEQEIAPFKARAAKAELALQLGLSNEQVDKVMEVKTANPNLTDQQALTLARVDNADMFAPRQSGFVRGIHGSLPLSGTSDSRVATPKLDHTAKMHEAAAKGDREGARQHAEAALLERFSAQFRRDRSL